MVPFNQARSMLSTSRTKILSLFLPFPKSQLLQLSRLEMQLPLQNCSKTSRSLVRLSEVYLSSENPMEAAVTPAGHQRTGSRGRDCFPSAGVLEVKGSRMWALHPWPSGFFFFFLLGEVLSGLPFPDGLLSSRRWAGSSQRLTPILTLNDDQS